MESQSKKVNSAAKDSKSTKKGDKNEESTGATSKDSKASSKKGDKKAGKGEGSVGTSPKDSKSSKKAGEKDEKSKPKKIDKTNKGEEDSEKKPKRPPKRKYAQISIWEKLKRFFCFLCIKELKSKPYRRLPTDSSETKKADIQINPPTPKTNDQHAQTIQKRIRGFLGRVKAKNAWKEAFQEVDDYWDGVKAERAKMQDLEALKNAKRQQVE